MKTITYSDKNYSVNEKALKGISADWKCILRKENHEKRFVGFYGEQSDLDEICNSGDSSLYEYSAEEIAAELALDEDERCSVDQGMLSHPQGGFWARAYGSDEGKFFSDFWDGAKYILTHDGRNGGTWTATEMIAALTAETPQTHYAMIEALMSIDVLEPMPEESEDEEEEEE
jgi:hypothetical protein